MRIVGKIVKWLLVLVLVALLGVLGWLHFAPPALLQGAMNVAAKFVCSYHFIAGRDAQEVLANDVHAPAAHPLLTYLTADVDEPAGTVTARFFGFLGKGVAAHRDGYGCVTVTAGGGVAALPALPAPTPNDENALWPRGERVAPSQDPALAAILDDPALTGPGMRAVVVVHNGRIIGERYGDGYDWDTPLLGWSMAKTVTAALVGTLVGEGDLSLDQDGLFETWNGDERGAITVADLLAMSSGLEFNEDYGTLTDVTRMLFLEPDMAAFAADKPLAGPRGQTFSYSSGTTVLLSRIWQDAFDDPDAALNWPREALFGPIGMASAVLEPDMRGTYVGSSFLYASARDWARFGELLRNDGFWDGRRILPEGFAQWMRELAPASGGKYGRGQLWLPGALAEGALDGRILPEDTFWLQGHEGQRTVVMPSRDLVVVRLGLTPSSLGYQPMRLAAAVAELFPAVPR